MKKFIPLIIIGFLAIAITKIYSQEKTFIKLVLDTKKFINPDCALGADAEGGISPVNKVYLHSGVCTTGEKYCKEQIIPYGSLVWEHVMGNWGENPQDDGIGLMKNEGNGVWSIEFYIEDYYGDPDKINKDWNDAATVQSTVMQPGQIAYTMGLVFRNEDATLSGRDDGCNDLFITDLHTGKPNIIQSSDPETEFLPLSVDMTTYIKSDIFESQISGIYPNPVSNFTQISYRLIANSGNLSVNIINALGKNVSTLYKGYQRAGMHSLEWNARDIHNNKVLPGIYFINISDNNTIIDCQRIIVL
ncbi:MAG: T9SS type A sorting domain-containing protein [Bacteroidales bacterium]|nr:T9SS type A sorting domain-containing protein [Bacteroidales bacterium]